MKNITITVNGRPFTYIDESEEMVYENVGQIDVDECIGLLKNFKCVFESIGIPFYLAYGTLLGAVREKAFIKGDNDIDVFTTDEKLLYNSLPILSEKGFRVVRIMKGRLYSFKNSSDCYIDVYILRKLCFLNPWSTYCYNLEHFAVPKRFFKEYQDIDLYGETYRCPKNPEALLEWWYGKDWRIPQSKKGIYETRSIYYIKNVIKFFTLWNLWHK